MLHQTMPSRRHNYDSSSSDSSLQQNFSNSRRRLPSPPPTGILRNSTKHVTIVDPVSMSRRVERIADSLEDTSRNLRSVDTKLSDYKDVHDDSMSALTKLQEDLEGSIDRLRHTREKRTTLRDFESMHRSELGRRSASVSRVGKMRQPTSPLKDYESDSTDYISGRGLRRPSSSLGIRGGRGDGTNFSSSVRGRVFDLSASQTRLEQDMNDEISHRLRSQADTRRSLRDLNESLKGENATERVEKRLKNIERSMQADRNHATQMASDVASDVLRRSQSKPSEDDAAVRSRMLQMEQGKRAVENELDVTRRRLEQSEGGREALMSQIGELRALITRSDRERLELQHQVEQHAIAQKTQLEKETEARQRLAASERLERDRSRQESEIDELRAALKRSAGVVQLDEMRRELEKSERQRQQLSDHIEVLTKDLEKKEQAQARVLNQHHELQRSYDDSERERDRMCLQLEDALRKLREQARDNEKYVTDLRKTEQLKNECEKEKEELRNVAQDTVRQWKTKCRKSEKEVERLRENVEQMTSKNEELVKESFASKSQANNAFQQAENLRKEMDDLIAKRAELEERLHRREAEIEQTTDEKRVIMRQLNEAGQTCDKQETKIKELKEKLSTSSIRLAKSEDETRSVNSVYNTAKLQIAELQNEMRELKIGEADQKARVTSENGERQRAEKSLRENNEQMQAMKMELNAVHKQLQIERETHKRELQDLHSQIHSGEVDKVDAVQRVSKKADEERTFLEGEIHRVNMEMNEARAANRDSQKLLSKAKDEMNAMAEETSRLTMDKKSLLEKYHLVKSSYEKKCIDVSAEASRAQNVEDDLLTSRDRVRRLEQELESIYGALSQDVADLEGYLGVEPAAQSLLKSSLLSESFGRNSSSKSDSHATILALHRRLEVVAKEVKGKLEHRKKAIDELDRQKDQMKGMCRSMEEDRRQLMSEVSEQNKLVDALSREKTSLLLENKEARIIVQDLEDRVVNLTTDLENSKVKLQEHLAIELTTSKLFEIGVEESHKERERIQERYMKYKGTIESLQAELEDTRSRERGRDQSPLRMTGRSPSPIKRVTISDSPIIHGYRPRSSSPKVVPEKDR